VKPEIKTQWQAELRSGKYAQGKRALASRQTSTDEDGNSVTSNTYCCLGVLCELAKAEGVVKSFDVNYNNDVPYGLAPTEANPYPQTSTSYLPQPVIDWAGLVTQDGDPLLTIGEDYKRASEHNDNERTFADIADALDQLSDEDN
jgi:hypothetical protein